jgi:hypothetical protein
LLLASGIMAVSIAGLRGMGLATGWLLVAAPVVYGAAALALGGVDRVELSRLAGREN